MEAAKVTVGTFAALLFSVPPILESVVVRFDDPNLASGKLITVKTRLVCGDGKSNNNQVRNITKATPYPG